MIWKEDALLIGSVLRVRESRGGGGKEGYSEAKKIRSDAGGRGIRRSGRNEG